MLLWPSDPVSVWVLLVQELGKPTARPVRNFEAKAPCLSVLVGFFFLWHLKPGGDVFVFTCLEVGLEKEEKLKGKISRC